MANRGPGIYYNINDRTQFENPKTTTGTTVAIVGYASKGEIGVPTEITSWNEFKAAFGEPFSDRYSGMAVKNVLSAGGKVLFTRVADATATPSNIVVKNAIEAAKGYVQFSKGTDVLIGTNGYYNGKIYTTKLTNSNGESKVFFVRSPASGKLPQSSILSQIINQNSEDGTSGTWEALINGNIAAGLFSFAVNYKQNGEMKQTGDVFVKLTTSNTKEIFVEAVRKAIASGTNALAVLQLSNSNNGDGEAFSITAPTNIVGEKKFILNKSGTEYELTINLPEGNTYEDLASKLNEVCSYYNVGVFLQEVEGAAPKLVFVNLDKVAGSFIEIKGYKVPENMSIVDGENNIINNKNLFLSSNYIVDEETDAVISNLKNFVTNNNFADYSIKVFDDSNQSEATKIINSDSVLDGFDVKYEESTNSIVFFTNETGDGSKIEVAEGTFGKFLFETNSRVIGSVDGQNYIDVEITRDTNSKKIRFISTGSVDTPVLSNITAADIGMENLPEVYMNLLDIQKDAASYTSTGFDDPVVGHDAVPAIAKDMTIYTSKECGTGTAGLITIEQYESTSPIANPDGTYPKKRDIVVKVGGAVKETFEDISINYADVDNRFDTIMNEAPENGGSAYVNVKVIKNDYEDENVQFKAGSFTLGTPIDADSVQKSSDIDESSYAYYDYMVGTDGIPVDGGAELFEEVMAPKVSLLANKDLYDFHVIIAPDDISETVQTALINLCEDRGDAVTIVDPPVGLSKKAVIDWHNGRGYGRATALTSTMAATYWPWCKVLDTTSSKGKYIWVMPSVIMAAKYVTVDKTAGSWYAPAGETNGQISAIDIEQYPNETDRDELYVEYNRINPFVKFKDGSIVAYGEKTLQRINSVLTKIHTQRMIVDIKKKIKVALKGYIFMPNTSDYVAKINGNVTAILESFKAGGGLSYYKVIADETNNTTETSQQDQIFVDVVVVPTGTIEEINVTMTLDKNTGTVTEVK